MLKTSKKFINKSKSMYVNQSDLTPHRMNCTGCRFYNAWCKGHGYPCSQCKRNSKNQKRPCMDYYKDDKNPNVVMRKSIPPKSHIK